MLRGLIKVITLKAYSERPNMSTLAYLAQCDVRIPELIPPGEYLLRVHWAKSNRVRTVHRFESQASLRHQSFPTAQATNIGSSVGPQGGSIKSSVGLTAPVVD